MTVRAALVWVAALDAGASGGCVETGASSDASLGDTHERTYSSRAASADGGVPETLSCTHAVFCDQFDRSIPGGNVREALEHPTDEDGLVAAQGHLLGCESAALWRTLSEIVARKSNVMRVQEFVSVSGWRNARSPSAAPVLRGHRSDECLNT